MKVISGYFITVMMALVQFGSCLHFYADTGETKCFFEELPKGTLVVGRIDVTEQRENLAEFFKSGNLQLRITVQVVDQNAAYNGDFTFTSLDSGEHRFCLTPQFADGTRGKRHRIFFDIAVGATDDYIDSKSVRKVDSLTNRVHSLNTKLEQIHLEQETIRQREVVFRDLSESTNSRVVKWTLVQLFVLAGTCFYQLRHLKSFFVKQKIV